MSGKFILLAALAAAVLASCQLSNPGPGGGGSDDVLALNGDWNGVVSLREEPAPWSSIRAARS